MVRLESVLCPPTAPALALHLWPLPPSSPSLPKWPSWPSALQAVPCNPLSLDESSEISGCRVIVSLFRLLSGSEMISGFLLLQKPAPSLTALGLSAPGPCHVSSLFSLWISHKTAAFRLKILKCSLVLFISLLWFIVFSSSLAPFLFPSCPMLQNPPFFMFQYICFICFQGRGWGGRPCSIPTATDSTCWVIHAPSRSLQCLHAPCTSMLPAVFPQLCLSSSGRLGPSGELFRAPHPGSFPDQGNQNLCGWDLEFFKPHRVIPTWTQGCMSANVTFW